MHGVVTENIHTSPMEGIEIPKGLGVSKEGTLHSTKNIHTNLFPHMRLVFPKGGGGSRRVDCVVP